MDILDKSHTHIHTLAQFNIRTQYFTINTPYILVWIYYIQIYISATMVKLCGYITIKCNIKRKIKMQHLHSIFSRQINTLKKLTRKTNNVGVPRIASSAYREIISKAVRFFGTRIHTIYK